jgi:hypothetical protein
VFHHFQLGIHAIERFVSVNEFAAPGGAPTFFDILAKTVSADCQLLVSLEEPEGFPNDFADRIVAAGFHPGLD